MNSKKQYLDIIGKVIEIQKKCSIDTTKNELLLSALQDLPILVPVVGEFSAGKSTLLNTFIGKDILSTNINPETAIPTELYYSEKEYTEGVTAEGTVEVIENEDNATEKYINLRRYVNSENLKNIQPITLVDMPGFDSPFDAHNKAIFNYLDKGSHYIVITPATAGTISRSMVQQIENIQSFGKDCSFIVSKTDLRSEEEVNNVVTYLEDEIKSVLGESKKITTVNIDDISLFKNIIDILDIDELVEKQFKNSVCDACYDLKISINTKISAYSKDQEKIDSGIRELESCLSKLEKTKEDLIAEAQENSYSSEVDMITNQIGREINSNIENLTDTAINQSPEVLQDEIQNIIQNVLVNKMNNVMIEMCDNFNDKFKMSLNDFNSVLCEFNCEDITSKLNRVANNLFDNGKQKIDGYIAKRNNTLAENNFEREDLRRKYQVATSVLAIATDIISPIFEVVIVFLPAILDGIFKAITAKQQREHIRTSIINQIPKIKREIRTKLIEVLKENSAQMIAQISEKYDEEITLKQEEIKKVSETLSNNSNSKEEVVVLNEQLPIVQELLNTLLK